MKISVSNSFQHSIVYFFFAVVFFSLIFGGCTEPPGKTGDHPASNDSISVTEETSAPATAVPCSKMNNTTYKVFIENSASMYGYLNGATGFKDALLSLLTSIKGKGNQLQSALVNNEITPMDSNIDVFINDLNPAFFREQGKTGNTEINAVIDKVMNNLDKRQMGILISDFIYSVSGKKVEDELLNNKYRTKATCQKYSEDLSILFIRMESAFTGTYYDYKDGNDKLDGELRPYFIWVVGTDQQINCFVETYRIHSLKGYDNYVKYNDIEQIQEPYFSILPRTSRMGDIKIDRSKYERGNRIKSINAEEDKRRKQFQFAVAIDYDNLPIDEADILDESRYEIESDSGDEFSLVDISPITEIERNDKTYKGSATHFLTIATDRLNEGTQMVTIRLKAGMPSWIKNISTSKDDSPTLREGKTFGIEYLVDGISEAYEYNEANAFFEIETQINK